jgi:uncharacterized protein (DUF885 family)
MKHGVKGTPLYDVFAENLQQVDSLSDGQRDDPKARVEQSITQRVIPAYQSLISHFEGLPAKVTRSDGAWALPDGEAYCPYRIESQTTTTMTADEIHALGLSEVAGIRTHMETRLSEPGLTVGTPSQRITALSRRPEFVYPNTDASRTRVLNDYPAIIDEWYRALPAQFGHMPKAKVVVKRVPAFAEKTAPAAYSAVPSVDGSCLGVFFAHLRDANATPRFGMRTLAYHETLLGHHLQMALAQELKGLPLFRKVSFFTAYSEGWEMLTILQLRDKTKAALGDRYDPRVFHDVVLSNGAVPLTVSERLSDDHIASKTRPSPA